MAKKNLYRVSKAGGGGGSNNHFSPKATQDWSIGNVVNVGFVRGLKVLARDGNTYNLYQPSSDRYYIFNSHGGLSRDHIPAIKATVDKRHIYTPDEDDAIRESKNFKDTADQLGLTPAAIKSRRDRLKKIDDDKDKAHAKIDAALRQLAEREARARAKKEADAAARAARAEYVSEKNTQARMERDIRAQGRSGQSPNNSQPQGQGRPGQSPSNYQPQGQGRPGQGRVGRQGRRRLVYRYGQGGPGQGGPGGAGQGQGGPGGVGQGQGGPGQGGQKFSVFRSVAQNFRRDFLSNFGTIGMSVNEKMDQRWQAKQGIVGGGGPNRYGGYGRSGGYGRYGRYGGYGGYGRNGQNQPFYSGPGSIRRNFRRDFLSNFGNIGMAINEKMDIGAQNKQAQPTNVGPSGNQTASAGPGRQTGAGGQGNQTASAGPGRQTGAGGPRLNAGSATNVASAQALNTAFRNYFTTMSGGLMNLNKNMSGVVRQIRDKTRQKEESYGHGHGASNAVSEMRSRAAQATAAAAGIGIMAATAGTSGLLTDPKTFGINNKDDDDTSPVTEIIFKTDGVIEFKAPIIRGLTASTTVTGGGGQSPMNPAMQVPGANGVDMQGPGTFDPKTGGVIAPMPSKPRLDGGSKGNPSVLRKDGVGRVDTADVNMTPQKRALLDTIASTEAPDYQTITGGSKFSDFSKHPGVVGVRTQHGPSTAAGRYQITQTTWNALVKKHGYKDFSPQSQDQAAWQLARADYHRRTGRNLDTDVNSKDPAVLATIRRGLGGHGANTTWQGLQKIGDQEFNNRFNKNLGKNEKLEADRAAKEAAPQEPAVAPTKPTTPEIKPDVKEETGPSTPKGDIQIKNGPDPFRSDRPIVMPPRKGAVTSPDNPIPALKEEAVPTQNLSERGVNNLSQVVETSLTAGRRVNFKKMLGESPTGEIDDRRFKDNSDIKSLDEKEQIEQEYEWMRGSEKTPQNEARLKVLYEKYINNSAVKQISEMKEEYESETKDRELFGSVSDLQKSVGYNHIGNDKEWDDRLAQWVPAGTSSVKLIEDHALQEEQRKATPQRTAPAEQAPAPAPPQQGQTPAPDEDNIIPPTSRKDHFGSGVPGIGDDVTNAFWGLGN